MTDKVGLVVARLQPLHTGHCRLITQMIMDCNVAIVGLGSTQKSKEPANPFSVDDRIKMLKNVYGDRIKIVPLKDIGSDPSKNSWIDYVFDKIHKLDLPIPTDYYCGRDTDSLFYKGRFWPGMLSEFPMGRRDLHYVWEKYGITKSTVNDYIIEDNHHYQVRMLHKLDFSSNEWRSGTEIRKYLEHSDPSWKAWVPKINHRLVEERFPKEFIIP